MRIVAVDWSGAARGEQRHLWLADLNADEGRVVDLAGRSRRQVAPHLIDLAEADPDLIVGLDFGFSLPGWFLDQEGIDAAPELWADEGRLEQWLATCSPPFWGRPGRPRPELAPEQHWRRTELATRPRPRSVFQIGGSGAVGTASLRGMPVLHRLRQAGFAIWPFDPPARPLVLEVWPRLAMGSLVKSRAVNRRAWLEAAGAAGAIPAGPCGGVRPARPAIPARLLEVAIASADAFDATAAALALACRFHRDPPACTDPTVVREGWIWGVPLPESRGVPGPATPGGPDDVGGPLPPASGTMEQ